MTRVFVLLAAVLGLAIVAISNGRHHSLLAGLTDPVLGLDHFLVLLAVGVWAGRLGGSAPWQLPATFLAGMTLGYLLGFGPPLSPELAFLIHVLAVAPVFLLVFGIVTTVRLPWPEMISTIGLLGACHGLIHTMHAQTFSIEPTFVHVIWFGLGSLASAATLMTAGIGVGLKLSRPE